MYMRNIADIILKWKGICIADIPELSEIARSSLSNKLSKKDHGGLTNMVEKYIVNDHEIEAYIAPWALPKEHIPLHFKWDRKLEWDEIIVKIPTDFEIVDVLNIKKSTIKNNTIKISKVKDARNSPKMYCGIIITYPKIPFSLWHGGKIKISFLKKNEKISTFELLAKVFRPKLEVVKVPERLILSDRRSPRNLPLHLRYIGFGDVQLKIEARIGGKIVSRGESLIYEILKRLYHSGLFKDFRSRSDGEQNKAGIWVDPEYVKKLAESIYRKIEDGKIPTEEIDKEMLRELREWLTDLKTREKFIEILYGRTKELLLNILMDILTRTPIDNVKLQDTRTMITANIKAPITNVKIKIYYRDLMLNEYPPIDLSLKIEDLREKPTEIMLELPILVEKWDNEPFLNVKDMVIGGDNECDFQRNN